ncbi:MAG: mechanosensitive ion channel family protein [Thermonemataceae bacterium]
MHNRLLNAWNKIITKLSDWLDTFLVNLPNLIIAAIVFVITILISKYISKLAIKLLERSSLQQSMKNLIARLISIVVILIGLFLVLGVLNLSKALNTILAGAGVAGLAVGLALQGALANTYSGIVLSYIDHIKYGDWVQSNDFEGEVVNIDLRAVTIKQPDNSLVYIPNKLVVESPIKNYSTTAQSRVILQCGVAYDSDLRAVKELVIDVIAKAFEAIQDREDILFLWEEFGDSSINFQVRFWINSTSAIEVMKAKSEAIMLVKEAFDEKDITIPFPIRTLDFPEEFTLGNQNGEAQKQNNHGTDTSD